MKWTVKSGDILDEQADVLICSANPFLYLSGGVGGSFLYRYGPAMQEELQEHLRKIGLKYVERGAIVDRVLAPLRGGRFLSSRGARARGAKAESDKVDVGCQA